MIGSDMKNYAVTGSLYRALLIGKKLKDRWWENRTIDQVTDIWRMYMDAVDYSGKCIKFFS